MGKASKTKADVARRERIAAQQAAARRAEARRRLFLAAGSILAVAAVVVTFILVKATASPGKAAAASNGPTGVALTKVVDSVTNVPGSVLDTVGAGAISRTSVGAGSSNSSGGFLAPISGTPLTSGGKPELMYVGANYCPFCAAERWSMIVALSRFGTFSNLHAIHSSSTDYAPNTPTFTFYGSSYTSKYLSFAPIEETQNYRTGNSSSTNVNYVPLQNPTAAQQALVTKYDLSDATPFFDLGNRYIQVGDLSPEDPTMLDKLSWATISQDLHNPSSKVAQYVDASANYLTAAILKVDGNQAPAGVITPQVKALEAQIG